MTSISRIWVCGLVCALYTNATTLAEGDVRSRSTVERRQAIQQRIAAQGLAGAPRRHHGGWPLFGCGRREARARRMRGYAASRAARKVSDFAVARGGASRSAHQQLLCPGGVQAARQRTDARGKHRTPRQLLVASIINMGGIAVAARSGWVEGAASGDIDAGAFDRSKPRPHGVVMHEGRKRAHQDAVGFDAL